MSKISNNTIKLFKLFYVPVNIYNHYPSDFNQTNTRLQFHGVNFINKLTSLLPDD